MTRKQLIEFLRSTGLEGSYSCETFANHMIEKGIVKVDEPFQITFCRSCNQNVTGKIHNATCKLIILREVEE